MSKQVNLDCFDCVCVCVCGAPLLNSSASAGKTHTGLTPDPSPHTISLWGLFKSARSSGTTHVKYFTHTAAALVWVVRSTRSSHVDTWTHVSVTAFTCLFPHELRLQIFVQTQKREGNPVTKLGLGCWFMELQVQNFAECIVVLSQREADVMDQDTFTVPLFKALRPDHLWTIPQTDANVFTVCGPVQVFTLVFKALIKSEKCYANVSLALWI